jgi:hypothetical protein
MQSIICLELAPAALVQQLFLSINCSGTMSTFHCFYPRNLAISLLLSSSTNKGNGLTHPPVAIKNPARGGDHEQHN